MRDPFDTPFLRMPITPDGAGKGKVVLRIDSDHISPSGTVHGGVYATVADNVMSAAVSGVIPSGQRFVTIELHVRYLRPVSEGSIRAESSVVKAGRRVINTECKLIDDTGDLLATATASYMVVD